VSTPSASSASSSRASGLDVRRLPWTSRLFADYLHDYDRLATFYAGSPASEVAWRETIAKVHRHARDRRRLADLLCAQLARREAPAPAVERARQLADASAVAIVTGQQAGIFGGPLFTLLKAVSAVRLASDVTKRFGLPAVAVFWIHAEDHDWDEVRACRILDADLGQRRVSLGGLEGAGRRPIGHLTLDGSISAAIEELESGLPSTEFRAELTSMLREVYSPGRTMAGAFARLLDRWLGARGLVVFDPTDADAGYALAPVFGHELAHAGRTSALAMDAGTRLAGLGYHAQVTPAAEATALFLVGDGRTPIRVRGGGFEAGGVVRTAAELEAEARMNPGRFSPNVLLRPIVQDTLLPTVCYIGGPSELAYFGQLADVYAHFGVPMPLVQPRASVTILDAATARFLQRHDLPFERLQPQDDRALNDLLEASLPRAVDEALSSARQAVDASLEGVIAAVLLIDPTLQGAARSTLGRMQHDLATLHGKVIQAAKRRDDTLRRQFAHARALCFPAGQPQERAIGVVSFLDRYGPVLVDRLLADLPPGIDRHWLLTL
jgi:bacillithiol biosynthesis cysteine-adding enzyme BshC